MESGREASRGSGEQQGRTFGLYEPGASAAVRTTSSNKPSLTRDLIKSSKLAVTWAGTKVRRTERRQRGQRGAAATRLLLRAA